MEPLTNTIATAERKPAARRRLPERIRHPGWCWSASRCCSRRSAGASAARASSAIQQRLLVMILQVSVVGPDRHRRDPGHHHGRHRPVVGLGAGRLGHGGGEPRAGAGLRPRRVPVASPACPSSCRSLCGLAIGAHRGLYQRQPDRHHGHPALHRDARHDGDGAQRGPALHARPADQHAGRELHLDRLGRRAGDHLPGHGRDLPHRAALHALRQVHLRDRRQPAGGAGQRHQRQPPHHPGLHASRACCRASPASSPRPARRAARPAWASATSSTPSRPR